MDVGEDSAIRLYAGAATAADAALATADATSFNATWEGLSERGAFQWRRTIRRGPSAKAQNERVHV